MYQHLIDFSEFTGQRVLSVLTMANTAGAVVGAGLGWFLSAHLPLPGWLLWPLCISSCVALTWPHESIPLGRLLLSWVGFHLRRRLAPTTLLVYSHHYAPQPTNAPRILLGGAVSYQGAQLPDTTDPFANWIAPPTYAGAADPTDRPAARAALPLESRV